METRRWTNPSQPQTLQIAVFLFYIDAVFDVLYGYVLHPVGFLLTGGKVAAGLGIASERRWGYRLGLAVSGLELALSLWIVGSDDIFTIGGIMFLLFPVARFALLVHPQSRDYQRIWFQ